MANIDTPFGLKPYGKILCADWFPITSTYGTALYIGTPVIGVAGGTIEIASAGNGNPVLGACQAFRTVGGTGAAFLETNYYPASSAHSWEALVSWNPNQLYVIQEDNDTTDVADTDIWNTANLVATAAGDTTTGLCGWELDGSGASSAADAADQLRIMKRWRWTPVGDYCKWVVKIHNHFFNAGIVGVGV